MRIIQDLLAADYAAELDVAKRNWSRKQHFAGRVREPQITRTRGRVPRARASVTSSRAQSLPAPDNSAYGLISARLHSIARAAAHTCLQNAAEIEAATDLFATWMTEQRIVRFLGVGRSLLAATMPGNRLAHGGAHISFMGGNVPLPNSLLGGGIVACSASGKTRPVLEAMHTARESNPTIKIVGLAAHNAVEFQELCDIFIGIYGAVEGFPNPLSALADTEESVINEILDGVVVLAGRKNGFDDEAWRRGHEDIGPTGPYARKKPN